VARPAPAENQMTGLIVIAMLLCPCATASNGIPPLTIEPRHL